jgi:hypothetical protein
MWAVACLLGCSSSAPSGPGLDASAEDGSGSASLDAGSADGTSPADGSFADATTNDGAAQAACEAAVDRVRTVVCTGTARQCDYLVFRGLCATERAAYIEAVFECLALNGTGCPTPSDPSQPADKCVQALVNASLTPQDLQAGGVACGCEAAAESTCDAGVSLVTLATLMMLDPSEVGAWAACVSTQGCSAQLDCENATPLGPANACPN